jgi:Lon protease-like protein
MAIKQLTIPMFPLGMLLLPGETKMLHIFEDKYKQLVSDCLANQAHFGIPYSSNKRFGDFGIEVKINSVVKSYETGEFDILVEGVRIFKLLEYSTVLSPKLYGAGVVALLEEIKEAPSIKLQEMIKDYLWLTQQTTIPIDAYDHATVYHIARLLDLSYAEKYELIKLPTVIEKENYVIQKVKLFSFILNAENNLKSKFVLN